MNTTQIMKITGVRRRKSVRDNIYLEIDFLEVVKDIDYEFENTPKPWSNVYYPKEVTKEVAEALIGKQVTAVFKFYPETRQSGEKTYTDIKMHLVVYEVMEDIAEKGSD